MHRAYASLGSTGLRAVFLVALFVTLGSVIGATRPALAQDPQTEKNALATPEDEMSPMGRLAHLAATGQLQQAIAAASGRQFRLNPLLDAGGTPGEGGDDEGEGPAGGQAELSIAVDATGQHIVVGCNDTRGFSLNPTSVSGFAYSDDGGATWIDGFQLPVNTGTNNIGATILPQVFGDPEVKYLGGSNFVYFSIMVKKFSPTAAVQTMCFHRSLDYGHTWTGPFEVTGATNPHGQLTAGGAPRDAADKEFADVDPETGRVMMSWSNFTPFAPGGVEISTTFSDNVLDPVPTWSSYQIVGATAADGQSSVPRFVGGLSSNAYVAWRRFPAFNQNVIAFARSINNGMSWNPAINLSANFFTMDQVLGNDRVNTSPSLAVDNSGGARQGYIYVVYANNDNRDGADVTFQSSTDGGLNFSSPIKLNSRPGFDRAQWYPWVTVDKNTGLVHVSYYDQGIALTGDLSETTHLYSDDGGVTWSKPTPLTERPFHAGYGNDTGQPNLGDYNQAVAQSGELSAVWAGVPNLVSFADGQPGSASMTVPDIYFKRISGRAGALRLGAVTSVDGNGNSFFDIGETVSLTLPLENYVTNVLSSSTVSGISATLSTTTPGVTVTQAASAYPNLGAGGSAPNNTAYAIVLGPSYAPGTRIDLSLAVSSSDNPATLLYTLAPPTPDVPTTLLSEDFNGVAPGALPLNWALAHGGGNTTVPWTTNNTFAGTTSNAAFHINANDGTVALPNPARFERLFSPIFTVPDTADYVTLDMDVAYDTEDDPSFNIQAFDGFCLRVTDQTPPPNILRSVLAEAFAEELTTDGFAHYPKHLPRGSIGGRYLEDMSVWGGISNGFKHVHMKLPGMAGRLAQLRFEYTQDASATCANVRPGHACGVMFDNLVVRWFRSAVLVQTAVAVDPAAGQYSDPVTLKATVSPSSASVGNIAGDVQFSIDGGDVGAPVGVAGDGSASLVYVIAQGQGSHTIGAKFVSTNPVFLNSQGSNTLTVSREDAVVAFSASNPSAVKVNTAGGTAGPITLTATINEVADGSLGNISNATPLTVTFSPVLAGPTPPCTPTVSGGGVGGTLGVSCTITNVAVNVYDVKLTIGGNYYVGSAEAVLTVYDPSLGFLTGGGYVSNLARGNFGANFKYLRNGNAQGSLLYLEHRSTGNVVLKSNAIQSLAIVGNTAVAIGKATLNGVGNYGFRATFVDNGEPGDTDMFGLQVTAPGGSPVGDLTFAPVTLEGGNVQVPNRAAMLKGTDGPAAVTEFSLSPIAPNPSRGSTEVEFAVAREAHVQLSVLDLQGREVARLAEGTYTPGRYRVAWNPSSGHAAPAAGIYFIRYQGGEKVFVRRLVLVQ